MKKLATYLAVTSLAVLFINTVHAEEVAAPKREIASQSDFTQDYLDKVSDERAHEETLKIQRENEHTKYLKRIDRVR
jgi:hypothetical protein